MYENILRGHKRQEMIRTKNHHQNQVALVEVLPLDPIVGHSGLHRGTARTLLDHDPLVDSHKVQLNFVQENNTK